jgi:hypothetical protein
VLELDGVLVLLVSVPDRFHAPLALSRTPGSQVVACLGSVLFHQPESIYSVWRKPTQEEGKVLLFLSFC